MKLLALLAAAVWAQEGSLIGTSVKSDKWNIKRGEQKVEEFTGNVVYQKAGRHLKADWALYDHDRKRLDAKGNLTAEERLEDGTSAVAKGDKAAHDQTTGLGRLEGRTPQEGVPFVLKRPDGSEQGRGRADRASWDLKARTVRLDGAVWVKEERGEAQAQTARFLQGAKRLELEGRRPVLTGVGPGWGAAVQADAVSAEALDGPRRRITGKGRAHGWLHFPQKGPFAP
jgi:lipopolysaccharide export system protein LptA